MELVTPFQYPPPFSYLTTAKPPTRVLPPRNSPPRPSYLNRPPSRSRVPVPVRPSTPQGSPRPPTPQGSPCRTQPLPLRPLPSPPAPTQVLSSSPPSPPAPSSLQRPELHVKLSLPKARYDKSSTGLRLRLTVTLAPHITHPVSVLRRGTIFDELCPLLGKGGFWGVADAQRRPVRFSSDESTLARKACTRVHGFDRDAFLEFGENFLTLLPGEEVVCESVLPAKGLGVLASGEVYTIYSRPDKEKKKPARAKCKWGTQEDLAENAFWMRDVEDEWTRLDVSHIVRDRDWEEITVVVANSVRFHVV